MAEQVPNIRVFISSPGDVNDERKIAMDVIEQFPYRPSFRDKVAFRIVAWDKPGAGTPMRATLTPQNAINDGLPMPSQCDIVIVLFWSRMGTPFIHTDGIEYQSGTHWELLNALEADRPETVIYRRTEEPSFKPTDAEFDDKVAQYRKVGTFFKSDLFYDADGVIKRGIHTYVKPDNFRREFESHFEQLVINILKRFADAGTTYDDSDLPETDNIQKKEAQDWNPDRSPFPGLRAFTEADADIFFGRGAETDALVSQLTDNRFVAVIASSGSGKSSLVGAGLIPRLRVNAITGSKDWKIARFTPGDNPFDGLFQAMITAFPQFKPNPMEARRVKNNFIEDMRESPQTLLDICADGLQDEGEWVELLLFVDQFEELFTLSNPSDAKAFVALLDAITDDSRIRVVVTMRADFYHRALAYPKLADLLRKGSFPLAIPRESALREMIESPAERAGITFEAGLMDRILDDVGDEPGNLALMAYALDELYKLDDDGTLTFDEYQALGGVRGAIGTRADSIWQSLDIEEAVLHRLFLQLIEVDERGTATRRRSNIQTDDAEDDITRLMDAFTKARLLTMGYDATTETRTVEVAHEAILREWHTLHDWTDERGADFRIVARMRRDAQWWLQNGKREQDLPRAEQTDEFHQACTNLGLTITPETEPLLYEFALDERERLIESLKIGDIDEATRDYIFYRLRQLDGDMVAANLALLANQDILVDGFAFRFRDSICVKAIKDLKEFNDKRTVLPLIQALNHEDFKVRDASAKALGELSDQQAIEPLIHALSDEDEDATVRSSCAEALGKLGDPRAVEPLIHALSDEDEDATVRSSCASALRWIGDQRDVEPLIHALGDEDATVRSSCASTLRWIGDQRAIEPLIHALGDEDKYVRLFSAEALGKLGDQQAVEPLIHVLGDEDKYVRASSAEALGKLGDQQAVEPLIQALNNDENNLDIKANAIVAIHSLIPTSEIVSAYDEIDVIDELKEKLYVPWAPKDEKHAILAALCAMNHPAAQNIAKKWDVEKIDPFSGPLFGEDDALSFNNDDDYVDDDDDF